MPLKSLPGNFSNTSMCSERVEGQEVGLGTVPKLRVGMVVPLSLPPSYLTYHGSLFLGEPHDLHSAMRDQREAWRFGGAVGGFRRKESCGSSVVGTETRREGRF